MMKEVLGILLSGLLALALGLAQAQEKLKLGTSIKFTPGYYLPILAAEAKGYFKENNLEVEWVPFRSAGDQHRAIVAGAIPMGLDTATGLIQAISRGVPAIIVADLQRTEGVAFYVLPQSPIREARQLKGGKIGVTRLGSTDHANAQFVAKVLGIEKEVRYVGTGGIQEKIAALKAGAIDAFTIFVFPGMELRVRGEIRELLRLDDYRTKEWAGYIVFSHLEFARTRRDTVRRVLAALIKGANYISADEAWARQTMRKAQGYSEEAAREAYRLLQFTRDGKVDPQGVENVRNFLVDYSIIPREQAPPTEQLYTREFTG